MCRSACDVCVGRCQENVMLFQAVLLRRVSGHAFKPWLPLVATYWRDVPDLSMR
jgi:hypothetical protein